MALGTVAKGGRPYPVALIPFQNSRKVALLAEFYDTCATFHYPEMMALSRALRISDRTIRRWKYQESFPRWDIAVDVIEWVRRGKPIIMQSPSETVSNMM